MPVQLSLDDLRTIISKYKSSDIQEDPLEYIKGYIYMLNLLTLLLEGSYDEYAKEKLLTAYNDFISSAGDLYGDVVSKLPNPNDMKFFQTGNRNDLIDDMKTTRDILGLDIPDSDIPNPQSVKPGLTVAAQYSLMGIQDKGIDYSIVLYDEDIEYQNFLHKNKD